MYFLSTPTTKKSLCVHLMRVKYAQGTNKRFAVCFRCGYCFEGIE